MKTKPPIVTSVILQGQGNEGRDEADNARVQDGISARWIQLHNYRIVLRHRHGAVRRKAARASVNEVMRQRGIAARRESS